MTLSGKLKMSLTGQWHFLKGTVLTFSRRCHWPVNDTFWESENVIDRSMTVPKRHCPDLFETESLTGQWHFLRTRFCADICPKICLLGPLREGCSSWIFLKIPWWFQKCCTVAVAVLLDANKSKAAYEIACFVKTLFQPKNKAAPPRSPMGYI